MTPDDTEDMLTATLAQCRDGVAACLANADKAIDRKSPYFRRAEMGHAVALLNAQARIAASLARLRGRQHLHITREAVGEGGPESPNCGSNGQAGEIANGRNG